MSLKQFTIDFQEVVLKGSLRGDFKFANYYKKGIFFRHTSFKDFITKISNGKDISKNNYVSVDESETIYPTVNNIKNMGLVLDDVIAIKEGFKGGYFIENNDIVITRSGTVGVAKCWDKEEINNSLGKKVESIPSGYLIVVGTDNTKINPLFAEYFLNSSFLTEYFNVFGVGKTQKNIAQGDIKGLPFPLIAKKEQDKVVKEIEPIERKIKELKNQIAPAQEVINKVFAREFGFDENLYNEFGKGMTAGTQIAEDKELRVFEIDFSEFEKSGILRFSTRFHNQPTKKLMHFLDSISTLHVGDVVASYEKGLQPKYDTDGDVSVVKIANLKNGYIDFSETEKISQNDFDKLDNKKKLKINDIIICATGKISLGKIDFYDYENEAIASVDNFIIRLNEKYNPLFFTYFFRSVSGYFQIERDYTGATNQIHFYWDQISSFQIPDISLDRQQKIVDEIKMELDKQEEMKKKIEAERKKIDEIIEKAIAQ